MIVSAGLSGGRVSVPVVSENPKTLWVSLTDGRIIKRHKKKHCVAASKEMPVAFEQEPIRVELSRWKRLVQWLRKLVGGRS